MKISKVSLYNNEKVVIENYNNIHDIDNNYIIIDNYKIEGSDLKIKQIEEYFIIIIGIINNIIITSDKSWNIM